MRSLTTLICLMCSCIPVGCAANKAVDSTRLAQAVTAGESQVTYTVLPGKVAGLEDTFAIPTVPGKDVRFRMTKEPDGSAQIELDTTRSAVLDMLMAGIGGIDAAKFAADADTRDWISREREAWMSAVKELAGPLIHRQLATPTAPAEPSRRDLLLDALLAKFLSQIETGNVTPPDAPEPAPATAPAPQVP